MIEPYYQDSLVTIYHGDCREVLPRVGSVDLILTDPPFQNTHLVLYQDSRIKFVGQASGWYDAEYMRED